jgi:DnaK suppressor protein
VKQEYTPAHHTKAGHTSLGSDPVLSTKKTEYYKQLFEARLAEAQRALATAEQETRATAARHPDSADQAAAEFERQSLVHKIASAQRLVKDLQRALERIKQGGFGECADCGGEIEAKRLEALPWAQLCVACQQAREVT